MTAAAGPKRSGAPLAGLRVLDLTRVLAGPFCTMVLADLGADVIKIEEPVHGDDSRSWGPPFIGPQSAYFLGVNRTKKSVGINIKDPRGVQLVSRLAVQSDVLIENFREGTMDRRGLGYSVLADANPALVYCSITGFGRGRTYSKLPGYDTIVEALGGLMSITGPREGPPSKVGVAIVDIVTGLFCATSVLAALRAREASGKGQLIEVSLMDVSLASLVNIAAAYLASGVAQPRFGNDHMSIAPFGMLEASDGELMIAVGNDSQWRLFCRAIERPELLDDPRFRTNNVRVVNRVVLTAELSAAARRKTVREWCELLTAAGVPAAPVRSVAEALEEERVREGGLIQTVDHPIVGSVSLVGSPLYMSGTPVREPEAPPLLGENTSEVLSSLLGLSSSEIAALEKAGVVRVTKVGESSADEAVRATG